MISLEKWKIFTPLQKLPKNVGNLGKIIVATGFEKLPKVQKIAQYGHTHSQVAVTVIEGTAGCWEKLNNFLTGNCLAQGAADLQCSVNQP